MRLALRILMGVAVIAIVAASVQPLLAQERVVVEERSAVVLKKVGNTIVVRNDKGEIKKYTDPPEGFTLYIEGEPAEFEDLEEGMKLHAVRFENVPAPSTITQAEAEEMGLPDTPAPPVKATTTTPPAEQPMAAEPAPEQIAELPATASPWPLVALIGFTLLLAGLGLGVSGRRARA